MRKIDLMHKLFGYGGGICRDCSHYSEKIYRKKYRKCAVYGDSNAESTDWKMSNTACGLYPGKPWEGRRIVEMVQGEKQAEADMEGQMSFGDFLDE